MPCIHSKIAQAKLAGNQEASVCSAFGRFGRNESISIKTIYLYGILTSGGIDCHLYIGRMGKEGGGGPRGGSKFWGGAPV